MAAARAPFVIGFASGLVVQMLIDAVLVFTGSRLLREAKASHPTDLPSDETVCDPGHLQEAMRSGLALRTYNLTIVVGSLFVVSVVSVVGAARFPRPLGFMWLAAFSLGAFAPTIIAVSWLAASASAMRVYGLTKTHLSRTNEAYHRVSNAGVPYPLGVDDANLAKLNDHEKEELTRFVFLQRIPVGLSLRGWFMSKDFAFVSYVWSDEQRLSIAERLDETLRSIGVRSFRDTHAIQDPFTAWREYISSALMRCTHFFLVVSPGIKHGQVVHREIETVLQRWFLEMLPAVICVVDPKDARELCDDHQVPLQVRILLICCPQMTISEARDPRLVRYIVEHTRRQGKWNDWLTMLSPSAARHRILRMPGIVRTREETGPRSEPPRGAANGRLG